MLAASGEGPSAAWQTPDSLRFEIQGKAMLTLMFERVVLIVPARRVSQRSARDNKKIENWWESDGETPDPFASEVGITESVTGAVMSGLIKIPYGWMNITAMI